MFFAGNSLLAINGCKHLFRSPFWFFNFFSALAGVEVQSQSIRFLTNIVHLLPYVNCAVTPILLAQQMRNVRDGFRSSFAFANKLAENARFLGRIPR